MTATQFIFIAIAVCIVIAGIFLVVRGARRQSASAMEAINYDKNGIPIIPRHERNIVDDPDLETAVAGETTIAPNRDYLHAIVEDEAGAAKSMPRRTIIKPKSNQNDHQDEALSRWQAEEALADEAEFEQFAQSYSGGNSRENDTSDNDAFSSLMSATDSLMPVIDTAKESDFTDYSPVLDQHLLQSAEHAQNAPLLNAEDNINITILPYPDPSRMSSIIRGRDLLALVDKYGLRFGAMNMFHRYQNKDGTGMLWFSMMGMTENGIAPFDPHNVATNTYTGIVLFLSLPHPEALMGFDSMMSIAALMAKDLDAEVLDENNLPISSEDKQHLRNFVRDYPEY